MCARLRKLCCFCLLLLFVGCGHTVNRTSPPQSTPVEPGFPVTLTDAQGLSVTVSQKPKRILSLSPTVTEMLFAIGAGSQVVAVTDFCNYPPESKRLPKIGQWWQPSVERALAVRPDLVIGQRGNPTEFLDTVRKSGCQTYTINPKTIQEIYDTLLHLGQLTGNVAGAKQAVSAMYQRVQMNQAKIADIPERQRPTAFIIVQVNPVWTAGKGTFQDEAIRAAGAVNVGGSVQDFKEFSLEKLLAANPDFLLITTMQGDPYRMVKDVQKSPVLQQLSAVKRRRIVVLDADEIDRPGPRLVNAIVKMTQAFYPERFVKK